MIDTSLFEALKNALLKHDKTLSCAESCTGGLFAAQCTSMSGSSQWFQGGVVAYANSVKQHLLAVPETVLIEHGAVSQMCAKHMATGGVDACKSDVCVSVTGIAGPAGGTPEKPVGTVFIAVAIHAQETRVLPLKLSGNREEIRRQSVNAMAEHVIYCLSLV